MAQVSGIPAWCTVASTGTLQFPVDRPLPKTLVRKLVLAQTGQPDVDEAVDAMLNVAARDVDEAWRSVWLRKRVSFAK